MPTLQRTIRLGTDAQSTNVKVEVVFNLPCFRYLVKESSATHASPQLIFREKFDVFSFKQVLQSAAKKYNAEFPAIGTFIQENDNRNLYSLYQAQLGKDNGIDIEDMTFVFTATFFNAETGDEIGRQEFEAFDLLKRESKLYDRQRITETILAAVGPMFVNDIIFLINKEAFTRLVDNLNFGHLSTKLLQALATEFKYTKREPGFELTPAFSELLVKSLTSVLPSSEGETGSASEEIVKRFLEAMKKDGNKLFDFPLNVGAYTGKSRKIIGDITVVTNETNVPAAVLSSYEVSLEYNNGQTARYNNEVLTTEEEFIENKPVDFQFGISENIEGVVKLAVKSVNGEVLWQQDYTTSDIVFTQEERIHIRVPYRKPSTISTTPTPDTQTHKKIRGKVIQQGKKYNLDDVTILVQGKRDAAGIWQILAAGQTDKSGNFSLNYAYGNFVEAQAIVALMPNSPVNLRLMPDRENETISDDFIYILLKDANVILPEPVEGEEEDCDCNKTGTAKRLPDQEDLVYSDEYTQDIGGSCVNLTTPNRTLKEYNYQAIVRTSDPDVSNYVLEKYEVSGQTFFQLNGGLSTIPRNKNINLNNPIRWQDAPGAKQNLSFYQAVSVATGHILHYKSVFKSDGYSLGDLLYSLPLAPGQKKQIVILDSAHNLTGAETQSISQSENLSANLVSDRAILDEIGGGISEALSGRSSASTAGVSAGLGVGGSMGALSGVLGVSGGYSNANSSASQNSSRNISQFFSEKLRQSISQNADSYRQMNATVVTTVREGQQYSVTTEAVANHNHCHALTMMYFEVLRHYAVFQELAAVEECVFVPLLMTNFTRENIFKWKDVLCNHLLSVNSNTYLRPLGFYLIKYKHPLLPAFDAIERILTNYTRVDFPNGRYADERMTEVTGKVVLRVQIPRPKTRFDRILSFPVIKKTITSRGGVDVAGTIRDNIKDSVVGAIVPCAAKGPSIKYDTVSTEVLTRAAIFDTFMTLDANYESVPPAQCIRVNFDALDMFENPITMIFQGDLTPTPMDFFAGMNQEKTLWQAYARLMGISLRELFMYFNNNVVADWDRIFNEHIAPKVFEKLLTDVGGNSRLVISPIPTADLSADFKYNGGNRLVTLNLRATTSLRRSDVTNVSIQFHSLLDGHPAEKNEFFNFVIFSLDSIRLDYATNFNHNSIINRALKDDLRDNVLPIPTPLNSEEKKNPRKEDIYMSDQLIQHLNSNLEHYNRTLWFNLDADRRYMLMDGFSIQIYNQFGNPIGYRSLASVIKNQLITVAGNSLVFPVAAGYRVSKSYIMETEEGEEIMMSETEALFNHYKPLTPAPPYRISVPNRGVFLEAVQGQCDACEKVKPNSSQDWSKFPTEEPTAIAPVVTPTPTITDWKAVFKDFAQPLVSIQNAPAAPAPGAGLAGVNELLGKAGVFNDITGLAGNQQNAMQTYLSNQENVRALAEMAKGMAMQEHNTANSDSIMNTLNNARESGAITPERHSALVSQHLEHQIDGGEAQRETAESARESTRPSLTSAAVQAAAEGRPVSAQHSDTDGNIESINIGDTNASDGTGTVSLANNSADLRAFHPGVKDKSGIITVQANISNIAAPQITWANAGVAPAVSFSNANSVNTEIRGLIPGLHQVRISARSGATMSGSPRQTNFNVCVPQFIRITENAVKFDSVLTEFNVLHLKNRIVSEMKATCDSILSTVNLRTIWQLGSFAETVPAHIPAANVAVVEIRDTDAAEPGLLGHADPHNIGWGPGVFNERIEIYPKAYSNPVTGLDFGVDLETQALIIQLESMTFTDPDLENFAVKVFGRLIGETMSHEIIHSIIGLIATSPGNAHNPTSITNDIMNRGIDRNFTQRTGLVDNSHTSPVLPSNFTDNGIASIDRLQSANQTRVDAVFPVNPA